MANGKVTLRELREEAWRVFGREADVIDHEDDTGAWALPFSLMTMVRKKRAVDFVGPSKQAARRLALACLKAMQPVEVGS